MWHGRGIELGIAEISCHKPAVIEGRLQQRAGEKGHREGDGYKYFSGNHAGHLILGIFLFSCALNLRFLLQQVSAELDEML